MVGVAVHVSPTRNAPGWRARNRAPNSRDPGDVLGRVGHGAVRALDHVLDRVDPEAVDAQVEPEGGDVEHRVDDLGVPVVEVGHLAHEQAQVARAVAGVVPGVATERPLGRGRIGLEAVPIAVASGRRRAPPGTTGAGRSCGWRPGRARRACRARARRRRTRGSRRACPAPGGRRGNRRRRTRGSSGSGWIGISHKPVTPRLGQVRQPRGEPAEVADAVAVGVLEAANEDLVVDARAGVVGPAFGGRGGGRAVDERRRRQGRLRGGRPSSPSSAASANRRRAAAHGRAASG